jgi:hypothetical protein
MRSVRIASVLVAICSLLVAACTSSGTIVGGDGPPDATAEDSAPAGPVDVPMAITEVASDGSKRFSVPIQVGGSPLDVLLDTGSEGLVILQGAVPDSAFVSVTTQSLDYVYGGGLSLTGVYAYAVVTIGGLSTPAPIPVMLVTAVGCTPSSPNCGGKGKTPADETLFGPYRAILGAGMSNSGTFGNPIVQLPGHPSFVVQASAYDADAGGTLRMGPTAEEVSTFATYQLSPDNGGRLANGTPSWNDRFPGCVHNRSSGVDYCESVFLDCGACPSYIYWTSDGGATTVLSRALLEVTIGPPSAPIGQYSFTSGSAPVPGVDEVLLVPSVQGGEINVGTAVYFRYDVLWDQFDGIIGLAPH